MLFLDNRKKIYDPLLPMYCLAASIVWSYNKALSHLISYFNAILLKKKKSGQPAVEVVSRAWVVHFLLDWLPTNTRYESYFYYFYFHTTCICDDKKSQNRFTHVWNPANPRMLQTLKKHMMQTTMLVGDPCMASMNGPSPLVSLVNRTRWVTAQANMNTQWRAKDSKNR